MFVHTVTHVVWNEITGSVGSETRRKPLRVKIYQEAVRVIKIHPGMYGVGCVNPG